MAETPENNAEEKSARDRFREALERKQNQTRSQQAHEDGRMKVKSMSGQAGKKRYIRRKTG
ncbi:DUF5302 domain-containing protein [Streptomyces genisteinicus]|uniref:DUF5302 domain-containing protein n=1 Tax=Streptomyces genisteinicus TaxID=2768068 RepID=A0A7H0I542_9ACTN|nr:DUF5302 domain-containing protein [Streptomyces genisteinicus]QNP67908.1 DUF5302 domain-containing protein [Streptomyces genisteinicus]